MSSPVGVLTPAPTDPTLANSKKRVLTDTEDTEDRDSKKARTQVIVEQGKRREKKTRRKRKRKVSIVQSLDSSEAEEPILRTIPPISRAHLHSVDQSKSPLISMTQREAHVPPSGSSSAPVARASSLPRSRQECEVESETSPIVDKGKARASTDTGDITEAQPPQVSELREQVSIKTNLVKQHETLVTAFQQSLTCQICLDLMHRPFALSPCGHSACYQCLVTWFKTPPTDVPAHELLPPWLRKKTCPHCRTVVRERPIEIWSIKEMVASLVKSGLAQAFFNPPSVQAEGAEKVDPWVDIFRPTAGNNNHHHIFPDEHYSVPLQQLLGLRDEEDGGIYRCIVCHHEIWDGVCSHCGRDYPGHDSELDHLDVSDNESHWEDEGLIERLRNGLARLHDPHPMFDHVPGGGPLDLDDGWIEDDGGDTEIESDGETRDGDGRLLRRVRAQQEHDLNSADEEDGYESSFIDDSLSVGSHGARGSVHAFLARHGDDAIAMLDDDDGGSDRRDVPMGGRRRGAAVIVSDDEDDYRHESDASDNYDDEYLADAVAAREFVYYGDDGSISRGRRYDHDESDEDDLYY